MNTGGEKLAKGCPSFNISGFWIIHQYSDIVSTTGSTVWRSRLLICYHLWYRPVFTQLNAFNKKSSAVL
jgi:hypothetical protein